MDDDIVFLQFRQRLREPPGRMLDRVDMLPGFGIGIDRIEALAVGPKFPVKGPHFNVRIRLRALLRYFHSGIGLLGCCGVPSM